MKMSSTLALAFAMSVAAPVATYAQTAEPTYHYHHHVHRHVHHHAVAAQTRPAAVTPVAVSPPPAQAQPFGLAFPHIAPYPDNKGDEDGLSEDVNDCNKGCIDGNPN